jgi:ubiquinone/menaquinone biosynthesis C-methylase UbiE
MLENYSSDISRSLWNENANAWIELNDSGNNYFRDFVTNPAFFSMLPNVQNKDGIDIGCGHGHNTRLLKGLCRRLVGIDYSDNLIAYAKEIEQNFPLGIEFRHGDATKLSLPDEQYDFATAFMSLIDIYDYEMVFKEVFRVLKKGGFFQFSILHPCFMERTFQEDSSGWVVNKEGSRIGKIITEYLGGNEPRLIEWMVDGADKSFERKRFKTLLIKRTQSDWLNTMRGAGFVFEEMVEPKARAEDILKQPLLQGADIVPRFQLIRCLKPV